MEEERRQLTFTSSKKVFGSGSGVKSKSNKHVFTHRNARVSLRDDTEKILGLGGRFALVGDESRR